MNPETARRVGLAAAKRAAADIRTGHDVPATVTAYTGDVGGDTFGRVTARVRMAGSQTDIPASVILGEILEPGDRVFVRHVPPHQFIVVGRVPVGGDVPETSVPAGLCSFTHPGLLFLRTSPPFIPASGTELATWRALLGTPPSALETVVVDLLKNGVVFDTITFTGPSSDESGAPAEPFTAGTDIFTLEIVTLDASVVAEDLWVGAVFE